MDDYQTLVDKILLAAPAGSIYTLPYLKSRSWKQLQGIQYRLLLAGTTSQDRGMLIANKKGQITLEGDGMYLVRSQSEHNKFYSVRRVSAGYYTCDCPARQRPCKHVVAVQDQYPEAPVTDADARDV
jgi:hypothetical protein